jgi:predicted DNA-binding transcriptional regulator AlpA
MDFYSCKQISMMTGITRRRIEYAIERGKLPQPHRIGFVWAFTEDDLARIKRYFNVPEPAAK